MNCCRIERCFFPVILNESTDVKYLHDSFIMYKVKMTSP